MRILVMHEDDTLRNDIGQRLREAGHFPALTVGVHDAIALVAVRAYDCAIINEAVPGTAGPALVEPLLAIRPDLSVIVLSDVTAPMGRNRWTTVPKSRAHAGFSALFGACSSSPSLLG